MRRLVTTEMVNLLIALAQDSKAWAQDNNETSAEAAQVRIIAAEIREALAEHERLSILLKSRGSSSTRSRDRWWPT